MFYAMRNKRISLAMAILFALSIMLSFAAAPAFAATSYSSLTTPTVNAPSTNVNLGTLYVKIDPMPVSGVASALITLPSDFKINNKAAGELTGLDTDGCVATAVYSGYDDNEFKLTITKTGTAGTAEVFIPLNVDVPSSASGDIVAEILNLEGQLSSGSVVVGVIDKGAVTVSVSTPEYISNSGTVTFTLTENTSKALVKDDSSVKFTLPRGFEWGTVGSVNKLAGTGLTATADKENRVLTVKVTNESSNKSIIRFDAEIFVDEIDAKHGDVEVTLGGKSKVSPSKLVVAMYADYGIKLSAEDVPEILAGRIHGEYDDVEIADIVIEETAPGTLVDGRTVLLTLPTGAKWVTAPNPDGTNADLDLYGTDGLTSDRQTARYTVNGTSTKAGEIILEDGAIETAVTFRGDLTVKVGGSAGVSGEVVVATVNGPISVTADKPNVKLGVQGQPAGEIIITEAQADALIEGGTLFIVPAVSGVTFDATPKVEVTEGDIEVTLSKDSGMLSLTIDNYSTTASTIKVSGITLTVNRAYPEGDVKLVFGGTAVNENYSKTTNGVYDQFVNDKYAASVVNAVCITPAPGDTKQAATFVIGSTTYTVDGVEQTMDVAPYVKDGRTYLPVRYVANALGVNDNNIMWDSASGTVTLIKGDKVVQVTVGSKNMVINGATIAMDAAPEITDGRTMLPFRWIAWAFGANVEWDGATQTVTMEL